MTNTTEQKTDKITLNTTNLKDGSGHTDTLLDAGTYTNKIKVDFTNSEILASDHFKKSNYTDKYANGTFIVEQRLVGVNTDAERVYGKQGNDMVIHDDTTGGADSSVEYSNKALFTGTQYDSRANGLSGLVAEDGSAFDTSTFVTKENSTSLDWLDVKYDADTKKVIAYEADSNYVDEETNLKEKDRITTTGNDTLGKNYKVVAGEETLQINKAALTIAVEGSKTYGQDTATAGGSTQYKFTVTCLNTSETIGTKVDGTKAKQEGDNSISLNVGMMKDSDIVEKFNSGVYLDVGTYNGTANYNVYTATDTVNLLSARSVANNKY